MNSSKRCVLAALICTAAVSFVSAAASTGQAPSNQTSPSPSNQTPVAPGNQTPPAPGNQTPSAPTNKTPAKPAEPPPIAGTPVYISPGVVKMVQEKLRALGHPMPTVSGAWGELSARGLAEFQRKQGLDPGGDLDEVTLTALGLPEVLRGEVPAGGDIAVSESAAAAGGAPFSVSPRLTRLVQNKLTQLGFPTHNVVGIWITELDNSPRNFQKSKGLDITNTLDLQLLHALELTDALVNPEPGKLPTDAITDVLTDDALLLTGTQLRISPTGLRQVQTALIQKGQKDITADGKWSDAMAAAVKAFQEAQKLAPTGNLNLRTLRALGFAQPLSELDRRTAK